MLFDDGASLARLIHLCKGEAGRAMKCCSLMDPEQGYARARRLLEQRFGDKLTITELWIKKLNEGGPRVNLQEYADELLDCYESLNALGALQEMDAQRNLLAIITRLPMHLQNKWQDYVFELRSCRDRRPTLKDVVDFVSRAAAVMSDPVYGSASMRSKRIEKTSMRITYAATADMRCPICNDGEHSVPQCSKFLSMNANDRLDVALKCQICFMCLTPGHITRECSNPVKYQEKRCGQRHATILHNADWEGLRRASREKRDAEARNIETNSSTPEGHHVNSSHHVMGNKVALPFLLVNVTSPETGISVKTYALLDSGSNVSLCQDKLLHLLKARGRTERMSLTTLEKENNETTAQVISLRISNLDGSDEITIPQVFARPNLRLSSSNLVTEAEVRKWPHLKDLPLHHAEIDDVALLIGQDCPEALMPLTTIPGGKGEPYAVRTRLGWSVSGPVSNSMVKLPSTSHYISSESLLQEKVEHSWQLESTNRVAEIQDTTNAKEWRHVPIQKNPADDASRGVPASSLRKSRWLHGPDFLQLPPERWPSASAVRPINEDDPEVKKAATFATRIVTPQNPIDKLIVGISNWTRLIRILACFALIPEVRCRKTPFTGSLEAEHLQRAEENLVRYIQNQCYPEEIKAATQGRPIPSSSPLKRLRPVLHDGLLVVPGRLAHGKLPSQAKRPVILPSRHPVIESLVRHVHERTAHSGRGYVLSELRRKYWILGATPLVKKVMKHCVACRR